MFRFGPDFLFSLRSPFSFWEYADGDSDYAFMIMLLWSCCHDNAE